MSTPKLKVLGATYGLADETATVSSFINVSANTLSVTADNATFGDSFPGQTKTLVIVYQYGDQLPQTSITLESGTATIFYIPTAVYEFVPGVLIVLGAAYGRGEMTSKVQSMVRNNTLSFTADNSTFFDTFPGPEKSMVIVFVNGSNPGDFNTSVSREHTQVRIS